MYWKQQCTYVPFSIFQLPQKYNIWLQMRIIIVMLSNVDKIVLYLGVVWSSWSSICRNKIAFRLQAAHFSSNWSIILSHHCSYTLHLFCGFQVPLVVPTGRWSGSLWEALLWRSRGELCSEGVLARGCWGLHLFDRKPCRENILLRCCVCQRSVAGRHSCRFSFFISFDFLNIVFPPSETQLHFNAVEMRCFSAAGPGGFK